MPVCSAVWSALGWLTPASCLNRFRQVNAAGHPAGRDAGWPDPATLPARELVLDGEAIALGPPIASRSKVRLARPRQSAHGHPGGHVWRVTPRLVGLRPTTAVR
ncbi:hypothetical protein Pma05_07370 [Plantactinospora mayteni]|uniref:Uncharacterized protein n=1 Tax=Plantactinospora mayteni TaxID=566021 RepID=A0ABQ4EHF4_9ACTN|nr:hypothetical protein Pma05_07370 [Plantactinospora mayteni]